jgi:thymidylate synthase
MNNVDKQYLDILKDIIENGVYKETRAGAVRSLFGKTMRFNLKEGLPILTTKKVFVKGIIHELLWFLKKTEGRSMNIKYLIENGVNIWTDDAYRWMKEWVHKEIIVHQRTFHFYQIKENKIHWWENNVIDGNDPNSLLNLSKEEFIKMCLDDMVIKIPYTDGVEYRFGDLGPVYGVQWRQFGEKKIDQIQRIIDTLRTNPDDRRLLCVAWNANDLGDMALPPCHYGFQVYTRKLTPFERLEWLWEHSDGDYDEWKAPTHEVLDELNVPRRELSLMFNMRSNDFCCGNPYNVTQYSMLAYMLCEICNMSLGEVIYVGGDVHVYENHIEAAKEQLSRSGHDKLPTLRFRRKLNEIEDFAYDDFIIENYQADPPIKYQLNVGL